MDRSEEKPSSEEPTPRGMGGGIRAALDRRVPQFVGLYVLGSWGFVQFVDWVVDQFMLSTTLTSVVFVALILLLPSVVVIAWRHGAPGRDPWKAVDGAAVGLNLLVMAGILGVAFRGQALGATTTTKVLEDPDGNIVERVVPNDDFQRSVLLFNAENRSDDPGLDWLEVGLANELLSDLRQDLFVTPTTIPAVQEMLTAVGLDVTDHVPLALKREASAGGGLEWFVSTSFHAAGDSLFIDTQVHDTETGRSVSSRSYRGTDEAALVDRMSVDIRRDIGVPEAQIERSPDLPVAELVSPSVDSRRALAEAELAWLRGDLSSAAASANWAVALDSTAAAAQILLMALALGEGNQEAAAAAMKAALRHGYRLTERTKLSAQVFLNLFEGDRGAALRAARFWVEVYPRDVEGHRTLADVLGTMDDPQGAIQGYRAVLAIDSTDVPAIRALARAFVSAEQSDSALAQYERILAWRPADLETRLDLGRRYEALGRLAEARDQFERAATVAPLDPAAPRLLARLDIGEGDLVAALRRIDEVRSLERTPEERRGRAGLEETVFYHLGQFRRLEEAYLDRLESEAQIIPPALVAVTMSDSEYLIFAEEAGEGDRALEEMATLREGLAPPFSTSLEMVALHVTLPRGDTTGARATLDAAEAAIAHPLIGSTVAPRLEWARGRLLELEGRSCEEGVPYYTRALELRPAFHHARRDRLRCAVENEDWEEADGDAAYILTNQGQFGVNRLAVARYLVARGRVDEARGHLDIVLRQWADADPEYRPAREAAALMESLGGR